MYLYEHLTPFLTKNLYACSEFKTEIEFVTAEEHDQLQEEHLAEQDGLEELSFFADIISDDK